MKRRPVNQTAVQPETETVVTFSAGATQKQKAAVQGEFGARRIGYRTDWGEYEIKSLTTLRQLDDDFIQRLRGMPGVAAVTTQQVKKEAG